MAVDGPPDPALALLAAAGLRVEADAADRSRAERDEAGLAEARRNAATIMVGVERIAAILGVPTATGEARRASVPSRDVALSFLCRAEAARLEETDDAPRWTWVAEQFDAIERPYPAAYARYRAGAATLRDRGARGDASSILAAALTTAVRLGARPLVEEIETLARHARLDLGVAGGAATDPATVSAARLGLTDREAEVLGFIAAGWSNQEIADALFISRKTVSVHASNIFDKLGAGNRSEAAAIAHRLGLDGSAPPRPGSAARQDPV